MSQTAGVDEKFEKNIDSDNEKNPFLTNTNNDDEGELTLEDLAPDGGWGWMIALSMIIVYITSYCATPSFTIVFGEFLESTGQAGSAVTLLNSISMVSFSFSGVLTSALLKRFSFRLVGVGAACLFCLPNILAAFVTHVYELAIIFFIQGIGVGLMNTIVSANFNSYFVKKRAQVMSASQVIIGLGGIVYPIMIDKMMSSYGFRGTVGLIGAVSCNCIVGMILMHPVEWHLKDADEVRQERKREKLQKLVIQEESLKPTKFKHTTPKDRRSTIHGTQALLEESRWSSLGNLNKDTPHPEPLLIATLKGIVDSHPDVENGHRSRSTSMSTKLALTRRLSSLPATSFGNIVNAYAETSQQMEMLHKPLMKEKSNKASELTEVIDVKNDGIETKKTEEDEEEQWNIFKRLVDLFELSILKDRTFVIMTLGISFVFVSDSTFSSLFPLAMIHSGFVKTDIALTITVEAAAELVSRILFALLTLVVNVRAKTVFFYAMVVMGFVKFAYFYFSETLTGIMVCMAGIGIVRTCLYVPQPLVVVENYPVELYAACYGVFTLVNGIIYIVIGPIIGIIKDCTDSFAISQLVLIALNCAFIVPWGLELIVEHRTTKKERNLLKN